MRPTTLISLRQLLHLHRKRLRAGDQLPSMSELANLAGVHRDTLYALIAGEKVNERSQYAISKALEEVAASQVYQPSRLLSVNLGGNGPKLSFGLARLNIFNK
jgi:hypothetical protein